ncbi:hypothetical protein PsYK624_130730 [Phanerochaete sordida]|uniref:Uncharacterized protein n=1 Tax=Phanerochaete sordida TaxID=48140 RepID=A0A9P3LIT6_9APHY|nr:hypothetical protein PsYK624_130730 [Phanerochaete sordida]
MPRDVLQFCRLPQESVDIVLAQLRDDKKALKACSLVSWAWSFSSATQLHEEFKWPPCAWRESCEALGLDAQDGSYTILLEALAGSPRLRESIRVLRIATHRHGCAHAYENDGSLVSTVFRLLAFLLHLRSLTLLIGDIDPATPVEELEPERQRSFAIDTLNLQCSPHTAPTVLSAFHRVSKLSLRPSHVRLAEGEAAPPLHPIAPVEVHSIDARHDPERVLPTLQHIIIPAAVHTLVLDTAPTVDQPAVLAFVRSLQSLKSLEYRRVLDHSAPFGDGLGHPSLRSVTLGGEFSVLPVERRRWRFDEDELDGDANVAAAPPAPEDIADIRGGGVADSEWREILRDLRVLVARDTEEVTLRLRTRQWRRPDSDSEDDETDFDPEGGARALRKAFSRLDWAGLEAVVRQSAVLRSLRFVIRGSALATVERTAELLREAVETYLAGDVAAKAHVVKPATPITKAMRHYCCPKHSLV